MLIDDDEDMDDMEDDVCFSLELDIVALFFIPVLGSFRESTLLLLRLLLTPEAVVLPVLLVALIDPILLLALFVFLFELFWAARLFMIIMFSRNGRN